MSASWVKCKWGSELEMSRARCLKGYQSLLSPAADTAAAAVAVTTHRHTTVEDRGGSRSVDERQQRAREHGTAAKEREARAEGDGRGTGRGRAQEEGMRRKGRGENAAEETARGCEEAAEKSAR